MTETYEESARRVIEDQDVRNLTDAEKLEAYKGSIFYKGVVHRKSEGHDCGYITFYDRTFDR